jgi:hypothetical protein
LAREPQQFWVADLNAKGELHAQQAYRYDDLERIPGASELIAQFSGALWRTPEEFEIQLSWTSGLKMRWRASAATAGIATLRSGLDLTSLSLLCTGINDATDQITLAAFQRHLLAELHDTGFEPGFDLMELKRRPLVATINFRTPEEARERMVTALADRCFAASYFRYHQLA